MLSKHPYKYDSLARDGEQTVSLPPPAPRRLRYWTTMAALSSFAIFLSLVGLNKVFASSQQSSCDTVYSGYSCDPDISHYWGQYSPYFSAPSEVSNKVPDHCSVSFANVLSRHGARDPTASKSKLYGDMIADLQERVTKYTGKYAFLKTYNYTLGADQLTAFGQQQMVNSGIKFYHQYRELAKDTAPFVRPTSQTRVFESAQHFILGFHEAFLGDKGTGKDTYPYTVVVVSEENGSNNTLSHGLCTAFEEGPFSEIGEDAQTKWINVFIPPIQDRLNKDLPGADFSQKDVIYFMDLCPFDTVASKTGAVSPFCALFSKTEWQQYDYYQTLGKWYGQSSGNPLGPTNGVGFVNELIARMTNSPVKDSTSTNRTLDSNPQTFPVDKKHTLFADFSHDNDMSSIFGALGLYNATAPLSNTSVETTQQTKGYSAAWTASFASRAYFEKLQCEGEEEELVRILVNDRVVPLSNCGADKNGMCKLGAFVDSLSFAKAGGHWDQCFA